VQTDAATKLVSTKKHSPKAGEALKDKIVINDVNKICVDKNTMQKMLLELACRNGLYEKRED
jgi:hypothetical protein